MSDSFCQHRLTEWLSFRETFLEETLRHDGLGAFLDHATCSKCGDTPGVIKCRDCMGGAMLQCAVCTVSSHSHLPLHRIEVCPCIFPDANSANTSFSGGMVCSSNMTLYRTSDSAISLDTAQVLRALSHYLAPVTSPSSTYTARISSRSITVTAALTKRRLTRSSFAKNGFQRRLRVPKRCSLLNA